MPPRRECPACEMDRVISRAGAEAVYAKETEIRQVFERNDGADLVCSYCLTVVRKSGVDV